jgi:hypothetical protein
MRNFLAAAALSLYMEPSACLESDIRLCEGSRRLSERAADRVTDISRSVSAGLTRIGKCRGPAIADARFEERSVSQVEVPSSVFMPIRSGGLGHVLGISGARPALPEAGSIATAFDALPPAAPHPVVPEPRAPRDFPAPPLRAVESRGDEAALRSAGRAAPDAADQGGLSVGRGAVKALASGSASLRALRVTAPRHGGVARDGAGGGDACLDASSAARPFELHTSYLRSAPRASAGTRRGAPAAHATQIIRPAREAGPQEEN